MSSCIRTSYDRTEHTNEHTTEYTNGYTYKLLRTEYNNKYPTESTNGCANRHTRHYAHQYTLRCTNSWKFSLFCFFLILAKEEDTD